MALADGIKSRWDGLEPREQSILRFSAVLVGLMLFYLLIIDPVNVGRDKAEERLRSAQDAFSVAQRQAFDLKASAANPGTPESGSFLTQVESSAEQQGLRNALRRLQPSDNDQIQVSLEGATYSQLMRWLSSLHQQGVTAQRVDIQRDRNSDLLGAQLLLAR